MTRWWRSHSVRMRLTLWYLAAMLVVLGVYAVVILAFVRRSASEALDQRLRGDFQWAAARVDLTPGGGITWREDDELAADEEQPWVQVWSGDGTLLYRSPEAERRPVPSSQTLAAQPDDNRIVSVPMPTEPGFMRVLTRRGRLGVDPVTREPTLTSKPVVIQVAGSETVIDDQVSELLLILVLGLPLAVAVAGVGGYTLARRALMPVENMTERARSISADRLHDRLPVENPDDEMGRLALVFNETLGRLETSFDQMRRFTADVSHELRTPLTAIRSVGEVGLRGHRDETAYRSIIGSMLEEVDRLASLVDRLLTLSRAETGQAPQAREVVDLQELAENVAAHLGVLAEEKRQTIVVEREGAPHAMADRLVLRQALINLVDNAIKYTPVGGDVRIRISESPTNAIFDVIDSGPGIPEQSRGHIFDRFFRAGDSSGSGGAGLGLSIAKGAVEASGGRLTLEQSGSTGSTFRITMPRAIQPRRRTG